MLVYNHRFQLYFNPTEEQMKRIFDELVTKNIQAINKSHIIYQICDNLQDYTEQANKL